MNRGSDRRLDPAVAGQNTERISRMFARFISVGYLAYLVILSPSITLMASRMDPWWTPTAVIMVFGSGLLLAVLSFRADIRLVRRAAAAAALLYFVAMACWPAAWNGPDLPAHEVVWLGIPGLAALAAAIAWPASVAFAYLMIACVGVQAMNTAAREEAQVAMFIPDTMFAFIYSTLFVGGAVMALRTGRLLDATTEEAHTAAADAAAERARAVERERFDALIHDNVMSTLLAASREQPRELVSSLAASTIAQLDDFRRGGGSNEPFPLQRALAHLRASAADADDRTDFIVYRKGDLESVPAESVRALGSALAEAVRNSRLHAGADATRTVTVTVTDTGIKVQARDDGAGFDPATVAPHRLGIAVSILGRMNRLPGGSAGIDTRRGAGTTVHLGWRQP